MVTVYLTRHGQTEWNLEKRLQGRGNSHLTKFGIDRAKELSKRMEDIKIDKIYTSPIERAYKTAQIIKGNKDVEIIKEDGLMEMSFGDYEGRITDEVKKENPDWDINLIMNGNEEIKAPNGESLREVRERVRVAMDSILKKNDGKSILLVAHGVTIKALLHYFKDDSFSEVMGQATLTKIIVDEDNFKIEFKNDSSHFTEKITAIGW
ncbi:histidine phosphatase family protein [Clostridium thermobutyricum]|uniref:histidine phosphatase family protein n=1 Tax=Clostridium thermobutyricum TaxID=29372 RepID=UPI0018AB33C4|nr:histidine phosphatase family protein [Clostridium thermobutyricum]